MIKNYSANILDRKAFVKDFVKKIGTWKSIRYVIFLTIQRQLINFERLDFAGFSHSWCKTERELLFVLS